MHIHIETHHLSDIFFGDQNFRLFWNYLRFYFQRRILYQCLDSNSKYKKLTWILSIMLLGKWVSMNIYIIIDTCLSLECNGAPTTRSSYPSPVISTEQRACPNRSPICSPFTGIVLSKSPSSPSSKQLGQI